MEKREKKPVILLEAKSKQAVARRDGQQESM